MSAAVQFKARSLKRHLTLWFGGMAIAVLLVSGFYLYHLVSKDLVTLQGQALQAKAQAAATELANQIKERELEIQVLSQSPILINADWSHPYVAQTVDARLAVRPEYAWLGILDGRGTVRYASEGLLLGKDLSARTWFQAGRGGQYVGDVHEARLLADLVEYQVRDGQVLRFIDLVAPIWDGGVLRGVVGAHIYWDWVWQTAAQTLAGHRLGDDLELLIFNADGQVLYPVLQAGFNLGETVNP